MTAKFPKIRLQTLQAHEQSPQVSPTAIAFSCYNNLLLLEEAKVRVLGAVAGSEGYE